MADKDKTIVGSSEYKSGLTVFVRKLTNGVSYNNPAISYKIAGFVLMVRDSIVTLHSKDV